MGDYYHYDDWATFDPAVKSDGAILKVPSFGSDSLFMQMDVMGALNTAILPVVFALVMTAILMQQVPFVPWQVRQIYWTKMVKSSMAVVL